jgi:DNA-binding response OmpR family regulator
LRRKLAQGNSIDEQVKTIRGSGYQLAVDRSSAGREG